MMECNRNSQNPKRVPSAILVATGRRVKRDHSDTSLDKYPTEVLYFVVRYPYPGGMDKNTKEEEDASIR
jgi:hypothetical protein